MRIFLAIKALIWLALWAGPAMADDAAQTLFDEASYRSLVAETKASRIGDLLGVVVQESASATSSADLRAQREFDANSHFQLTAIRNRNPLEHAIGGGTSTASEGAGSTRRSGNLLAQLSVRVIDVRVNGDLVVSGQQSMKINGEEQLITLSGIVRPSDVSSSNTVLSNRIAEARIEFDGKGFVSEQSKPGLIAKLLTYLGF